MKDKIYLLPELWCKLTGIEILDPDGWNRADYQNDWNKPLNFEQFYGKAILSTVAKFPKMEPLIMRDVAITRLFFFCENS